MGQIAVDDNPAVLILGDDTDTLSHGTGYFTNRTGGDTIYVGGPNVTASTGYPIAAGEEKGPFDLATGAKLYAICGSGDSATVDTLTVGV